MYKDYFLFFSEYYVLRARQLNMSTYFIFLDVEESSQSFWCKNRSSFHSWAPKQGNLLQVATWKPSARNWQNDQRQIYLVTGNISANPHYLPIFSFQLIENIKVIHNKITIHVNYKTLDSNIADFQHFKNQIYQQWFCPQRIIDHNFAGSKIPKDKKNSIGSLQIIMMHATSLLKYLTQHKCI